MTRKKRFVYTRGGQPIKDEAGNLSPVEVSDDWSQTPAGGVRRSEEEVFGHLTATDGADLSTRKRWRDYMAQNNLTHMDDFKETWAKAAQQRERESSVDVSERKRDLAESMFHTRRRK